MNEIYGTQLGTQHIANNPDAYQPQTSLYYEFIVTGIDKLLKFGATENSVDPYITNGQEVIRYSTDETSVPSFSQNPISIQRGNGIVKFAGKIEYNTITLRVNEYIGSKSLDVLLAWQKLSGNIKGQKVGYSKDYKKTCYLCIYDGSNRLVKTYKIYGCWISSLDQSSYSVSGSGDIRQVTATIQYDTFDIE